MASTLKHNIPLSNSHIENAGALFSQTGYSFGHIRCQAYHARNFAHQGDRHKSTEMIANLKKQIRWLPRIFQVECLHIFASTLLINENSKQANEYWHMAKQLVTNYPIICQFIEETSRRYEKKLNEPA